MNQILFDIALVEAVFGGLAAGKTESSSYVAGIKHVVIMVVIAIIAFQMIKMESLQLGI